MMGIFTGLYGLAIVGGLVTVTATGSILGSGIGVAFIGISAGISAHLCTGGARPRPS
ncbi:MAG: hypothetical protein L3K15_00665 [Thermoplasmata archaeon]|nr:hypothetical protein [Thermoplasmata archaeon]